MENITFDSKAQTKTAKEDIEWLRIWCEQVNDADLPHVALVGDSITEGYYGFVKKALEGIARVDYLATSYSIASPMYQAAVKAFLADSDYAVVHYNYGLHAYGVGADAYARGVEEIVTQILKSSRAVLATTTTVLDATLLAENTDWREKVLERNACLVGVSKRFGIPVDELNAVCRELPASERNADGVHFKDGGYLALSKSVVGSIRAALKEEGV